MLHRQVEEGGAGQHTAGTGVEELGARLVEPGGVGRPRVADKLQSHGQCQPVAELGLDGVAQRLEAVAVGKTEEVQGGLQGRGGDLTT